MENHGDLLHSQLVSIVEVLANAAVLEICKLVDEGFSRLRLEVSRTQRENLELRDQLRRMEAGAPVPPPGSRSEEGCRAESLLGNQDGETDLLEEKPVVVIKAEQLEQELTGCIMGERHPARPATGTGVVRLSLAPDSAGAGGDGGCHAQQGAELLTSDPGSSHAPRSAWASSSPCVDKDAAAIKTPAAETLPVKTTTEEEDESPSFDSFDDLFSSPDVARSLNAPGLWEGGAEERLASSFSFLTSSSAAVARDPMSAPSDGRGHRDPPQCARGQFSGASREPAAPPHPHAGLLHLHQLHAHQLHPPAAAEHPFSCRVCGKYFSQSSHIKRHMSVHTGERRYGCSVCGKRFSQACSLKVHQAVHTGERPYGCTQCGKRFSLLGNMVRHQALHVRK